MTEIIECPPHGERFEAVLRLAKRAKKTVGFLPDSAFRDRAERGTLLLAIGNEADNVAAYCLYDLPRDEVRVRQLVTAEGSQTRGLARLLIDELCIRHPSRRGLVLDCRRDYGIEEFWTKVGFVPVAERAGRSDEQLPLTTWIRDFGHPNLLTLTADYDERLVAGLDANIVIDLADGAETTSEALTAEWIQNSVRFAVTGHARVEINRQNDGPTRRRHFQALSKYGELQSNRDAWVPLLEALRTSVPNSGAYDSDLTHAAQAAAGGARWLVTRDGRFGRACAQAVKKVTGLDVVSPGQLLMDLDAIVRGDDYRPTDLAGSHLELRDIRPPEFDDVARTFVNQREGEPLKQLRGALESLAASHGRRLRVLVDGDALLGVMAETAGDVHRLPLVRASHNGPQTTIARQLLATAREQAAAQGAPIQLTDAHCGESVRKAATAEGFVAAGPAMVALPVQGFGNAADLVDRVGHLAAALRPGPIPAELIGIASGQGVAAAKEDAFAPWRLTTDELPTFVIPIEPAWAAELFDSDIARTTLFGRGRDLALQREHVYYRSALASGGLTAPARILWYVKKGPSNGPAIRAISTLREVAIGEPRQLHKRFAHLGVFRESQVRAVSKRGRVMALRFSHSSMLPKPISLDGYRDAMRANGSGLVLQSPQRLPEHMFAHLATMAL